MLDEQKEQQQEDLMLCLDSKNKLTDTAHTLAEKYEESMERHDKLIERWGLLMYRLSYSGYVGQATYKLEIL